MRFIFDYVTCCMMSPPCNTEETSSHGGGTSSSSKTEDETRSLVTVASRIGRRRKRTPTRGSSADWRPSLFAIEEDNAVAVVPVKKVENVQRSTSQPARPPPSSSQRNVKRCGASSSVRVNASSRSYDFSREPIPLVIPAFSAAPFMF